MLEVWHPMQFNIENNQISAKCHRELSHITADGQQVAYLQPGDAEHNAKLGDGTETGINRCKAEIHLSPISAFSQDWASTPAF
jgi:hypothetical protein